MEMKIWAKWTGRLVRKFPFNLRFHLHFNRLCKINGKRPLVSEYQTTCNRYLTESVSDDDRDGNENVKKAIGLMIKTTILHVHYTFWYISLSSLDDKDMKCLDGMFYGGTTTATATKTSVEKVTLRLLLLLCDYSNSFYLYNVDVVSRLMGIAFK